MRLRYLRTLTAIGGENSATIVFPMPIDIIKPRLDLIDKSAKPAADGAIKLPLVPPPGLPV